MNIHISTHAAQRWIERVAAVSPEQARLDILDFVANGRTRETPRHWMRRIPQSGDRFVYWSHLPGVCVVLNGGGIAVTVYSQATSRGYRDADPVRRRPCRKLATPSHARWRLGGAGGAVDFFAEDERLLAT